MIGKKCYSENNISVWERNRRIIAFSNKEELKKTFKEIAILINLESCILSKKGDK